MVLLNRYARACVLLLATAVAGLASGASVRGAAGQGAKPAVRVGMVYSGTGALASYGAQFREGFQAGLAYAANNTGATNGHKIDVSWNDDATDPAKGVSAAKDLIGQGVHVCLSLRARTGSGS